MKVYVIDTNVLVDYPEIIPSKKGEARGFQNSTVDLAGALLLVPSAVIRELSGFKGEMTERGKAARTVLRNLRDYYCHDTRGMLDCYNMVGATVELPNGCYLTVLPVHADFKSGLPFRPAEDDMDGQIILAALAVMHLNAFDKQVHSGPGFEEKPAINWSDSSLRLNTTSDDVVLLTNDNGLAIRAEVRGVKTSRYSYDLPTPYMGRREVTVPEEIFTEFYEKRYLARDLWEDFLPGEGPLVANEFVVMRLDDPKEYPKDYDPEYDQYYRYIARYDAAKDALVGLTYVSRAPFRILNDGQAMYAEALLNPAIAAVICTGPAGSGKTYLPTVYGLHACQNGDFLDTVIVPCADFGNLGALPGGLDEKMVLDVGPIRNAIRNYLLNDDSYFKREFAKFRSEGAVLREDAISVDDAELSISDRIQMRIGLLWHMFFRNIPVKKAQGLDFAYELVLYDEFQDQSPSQADMLIKRIGKSGKIVITGDIKQVHAPYLDEHNNGIVYATYLLYNTPMVARVSFFKEEVERHELVRMIAERQNKPQNRQEGFVSTPPRTPD